MIICAKDAHVEVAERTNRLLKERIRSVKAMLPYNKYPQKLLMEIINNCPDDQCRSEKGFDQSQEITN